MSLECCEYCQLEQQQLEQCVEQCIYEPPFEIYMENILTWHLYVMGPDMVTIVMLSVEWLTYGDCLARHRGINKWAAWAG